MPHSLRPSLSISLARFHRTHSSSAHLHYVTVTCLAPIGRAPPAALPHLPYTGNVRHPVCSVIPRTCKHADLGPRFSDARILRNIHHDVIQTLPTGRYYQSLRRNTIWRTLVPRCLFDDYCFLVQLLATSLTTVVSDRVESSSALPIYKSPRRHASNNTSFQQYRLSTPFLDAFFTAAPSSFTS